MVLLEKNAVTVCDGNTQESEAAVSVRNGNGLSKLSGLVSKRALHKLKERIAVAHCNSILFQKNHTKTSLLQKRLAHFGEPITHCQATAW